jgi:CDP-diacylglycerol--serine O-phosphatidyltransferase
MILIILILYVLAALIRLAYFNVMEDARQEETAEARKSYEGLPVTTVALIIPLLYPLIMLANSFAHIAYGSLLLVIAILFLSKIKITKFKLKGMIALVIFGILELLLLIFTKSL